MEWPFVSRREYQRALAERNEIDRCLGLAQATLEAMERALKMVEWQPIHDPDTHELLGQLCLWCNRKPHSIHCERQKALAQRDRRQIPDASDSERTRELSPGIFLKIPDDPRWEWESKP